jgi:glycosyltransferase involved in cell wall biosynthesis
MNVALFLSRSLKPSSGGTYSFERDLLLSLANYTNKCSHKFYIFGWDFEKPQEIIDAKHIVYIYCFSLFRRAKNIYRKLPSFLKTPKLKGAGKLIARSTYDDRAILKKILKYNIDVTWSLGLNPSTLQIPNIVTVWDLQHRLQPYFPELGAWKFHEEFYLEILGRSSYVITGTMAGKSEVQQFYNVPDERIKVIPFATPFFALNSAPKEKTELFKKFNLPFKAILDGYLFYPAQFWPHKNHVNLLLAIKYLRDELNVFFPLVLTGSDQGNLEYVRKCVANLNLSSQVHFLGFVSQTDLASLYHHAFALTFVSLYGPDNLPPLEAFALGCPVIASNVSGAEEQLGTSAMLVNCTVPEEIAFAIMSLRKDPDLRQTLIDRGLKRALQWTGQDYVREVCSILDEFAPIRRCWSNSKPYNLDIL